jgi:hypothetical protein
MIDRSSETIISLAEAARRLPARRAGKKAHISCLYRYTVTGCRGVVLDWIQVGATRCTSEEALDRFIEALTNKARQAHVAPAPAPLSRDRRKAIEAAEKRLALAGV